MEMIFFITVVVEPHNIDVVVMFLNGRPFLIWWSQHVSAWTPFLCRLLTGRVVSGSSAEIDVTFRPRLPQTWVSVGTDILHWAAW